VGVVKEHLCDVIAFAPHPDDAELCCGGTLALLASMDYRVGVIDLTDGERGTRGTPAERRRERERASEVLGLHLREGLGLPDTGISSSEPAHREAVVAALREHRPAIVLAPHWADRHPDHIEGSALVTASFFLAGAAKFGEGEPFKPRALAYYQGSAEFQPSVVVDISKFFERKMKAVECYSSQFSEPRDGEPATDIAHPHFLERVRARARHYGLMVGVEYGEPFYVKAPPVAADLVEFLVPGGGD